MKRSFAFASCVPLAAMLITAGCGGGSSSPASSAPGASPDGTVSPIATFSLGGTVTGLNSGGKLTLQDKGGATLELAGNGAFSFANKLPSGSSYAVSIGSMPTGQRCEISQGSGTISSAAVTSIAVTCKTAYAYVVSVEWVSALSTYQYSVSQYTFGANGQMRASGAPAVPISSQRISLTIDSKAANAFISMGSANAVRVHTIGAAGELSSQPMATVRSGDTTEGTRLSPDGRFLYSFNSWDGSIYRYPLEADGGLAALTTGTQVASVHSVYGMAIDSSGKYAYASDGYSSRVYQFSISDDGRLVPAATASVAAGSTPTDIVLDPGGKFAYTVNSYGGSISQYEIGADGMLTPMDPANVAIAGRGMFMAITPNGKYAYANGGHNTIEQFAIGANGRLASLSPARVAAPDDYSMQMAFDATGAYAYVPNNIKSTVTQYAVGADGQLTEVGNIATPGQPGQIILFHR
ncbi:beta-propeller fold lactonase family protein [Pseudoduganella sp. SL102]|uniref:lactonase family protein n=1 Tax=Pseudoduganella sp. SL102 TaxID=2995154 RepID=UPI00248AF62C|nr:beta-propeller fold lactonase family protein [Pseudoduganella sp. SL102]WBS03668.1 beta-propeller fold lactonase family protein [Pseudoduganella sp. SL102]